jgi:hypothetical protein
MTMGPERGVPRGEDLIPPYRTRSPEKENDAALAAFSSRDFPRWLSAAKETGFSTSSHYVNCLL